ncbi:MAG: DUF3592 domain-containing protein [Pseudomonadota bacterium]
MEKQLVSRSDVTTVLVLFLIIAVLGFLAAGFFVRDYSRARASHVWPVVEGIVLSRRPEDGGRVRYVYSYRGRTYEAHRERVFSAQFLKAPSQEFTPGAIMDVYVNPADPEFSVLYPGGATAAFVVFSLLSGLVVFIGVGGIVWTLSDGAAGAGRQFFQIRTFRA